MKGIEKKATDLESSLSECGREKSSRKKSTWTWLSVWQDGGRACRSQCILVAGIQQTGRGKRSCNRQGEFGGRREMSFVKVAIRFAVTLVYIRSIQ